MGELTWAEQEGDLTCRSSEKGKGDLHGGASAPKGGALGLSGKAGLAPAWGTGSAREKLGVREGAAGPDPGGEPHEGSGLTAPGAQTPNPAQGQTHALLQPVLPHSPVSPGPGKLGGQLSWMVCVVATGNGNREMPSLGRGKWQDLLMP